VSRSRVSHPSTQSAATSVAGAVREENHEARFEAAPAGGEQRGGQLLAKGLIIWTTNAITFGLWFWNVDRGGPARRLERNPPPPDFLFPQLSTPGVADPSWSPRL
jgi:hypothetical protein